MTQMSCPKVLRGISYDIGVICYALVAGGCTLGPVPRTCVQVEEDPAFTADESAEIHRAEIAWSRATPLCFVPASGRPDVTIRRAVVQEFITDVHSEDTVGLYVYDKSLIWIVPYQDKTALIAAHEIGHFLGLGHAKAGCGTVMAPAISGDVADLSMGLPDRDARAFDAGTGFAK